MTDPRSTPDRVLDQLVEQMHDHQATLAEFSARLENSANDLIEHWTKAYHDAGGHQSPEEDTPLVDSQTRLIQSLFGDIKQGNLRKAFADYSAWSRELAQSGFSYDRALQLVREQQRATLTAALPFYQDDPQLPLMLDALDDWFDGAVIATSIAYLDARAVAAVPPQVDARYIDSAKARVLGQLTGGMTHALNNLLTALMGQSQLLLERADDSLRAELQEIQNTAAIGARVVRRIQEYAGTNETTAQVVEINQVLRDASEILRFRWRDQAEAEGIVIDVVKDFADVPPVFAHPAQLRQAFVALILNAVEAMPRGGLITLRTERQANNVLISIIDHGEGMTEEVRVRATEPFFTTKPSPHLGLGLVTVADIIAHHGGTLNIASEPTQGTTVGVVLPITQRTVEKKDNPPMTATRRANVLVIDNEPSVSLLLSRLLRIQGHSVVTAESGAEGIAAFKKSKFDIVFTDLGMPEMSGWDVAREIKKHNAKTLVALTTGWPIDAAEEELRAKGVDRVMNKPFDLPTIYRLVDEAVATSENR